MKRSREKQRAQETQSSMVRRKGFQNLLAALLLVIRLALAFACGWLLGCLIATSTEPNSSILNILLFVVFPPVLGIAAPWTVGRHNKHLILLSLGTGLLVVAGIYVYWLPLASQADATMIAYCGEMGVHCHVDSIEVFLLNLFLFYGSVIVLLETSITGLILKWHRIGE